ncbi:caspase family protein [Acidovorax sp. DW039]|uniref:C13 family peptidase n=1 Tax=Acidovorax sp. DW039 TaxID=3095606 RepID=UPI00308498D3|nr:caspase family protein [Acidovorax sp. DW039]
MSADLPSPSAPTPAAGPESLEAASPTEAPPALPAAPAAPRPASLSAYRWLVEGLRAAVFLRPRTGAATPSPLQLLMLLALCWALSAWGEWAATTGPVEFSLRGWLGSQWLSLLMLGCAWWAMHRSPASPNHVQAGDFPQGGPVAWLLLSNVAALPTLLPLLVLPSPADPAYTTEGPLWQEMALLAGGVLTLLWLLAVLIRLTARFAQSRWRTAVFAVVTVAGMALHLSAGFESTWMPATVQDDAAAEADAVQPPVLTLSQSVFEGQQLMLEAYTQDLVPERPGVVDVYGLVFAPYAGEEVFRRESTMVSELLQDRFDARGRVLHLLNHAQTADTHLWATPENLRAAIEALADTMDIDNDVLVVYMTSHGARDHQLAAAHPPLQVDPMTPELLRHMLDDAGIRHRVIAISACYSGGWIDALTSPSTLIMTAADATHTSYGCGMRSELTFFGRAVFDEQLRSTYSFAEAFAKAVPIIAQREVEAGKADGFSNPQIRIGHQIEPVLQGLAQRLEAEANGSQPVQRLPIPLRPGGKGLVAHGSQGTTRWQVAYGRGPQIPMAQAATQLR